ncbi:hypothetical protein OPIT5_28030 [Opitutaceae bacterium TAV5]|nr:hypothetical protein OPIT5_28030 [Opitutaceae bacterium TAV5]
MKTVLFPVFSAFALTACCARADVSLVCPTTAINVLPGETFSVTLNLLITGDERVSGVDYFWRIDGATSGMFAIIGRDFAGSVFDDPMFSNAAITQSPANELAPQNGHVLGAVPEDWETYADTGTHFLATYTFSVSTSVTGTFVLGTVSHPDSGWGDTDFNSHDFTGHATVTLNVGPFIPEPVTCSLLIGILVTGTLVCHRRQTFRAKTIAH